MEVKEFQTSEAVATFCTRRRRLNHPQPHLESMDTHHHRDQHALYAERYPMCACRSSPWIAKNNPYKAAGLWETVDTAIPRYTGPRLLRLFLKLPAAGILSRPISFIYFRIVTSMVVHESHCHALRHRPHSKNCYMAPRITMSIVSCSDRIICSCQILEPAWRCCSPCKQQPQQQLQQRQRAQSILVKPVVMLQDFINRC